MAPSNPIQPAKKEPESKPLALCRHPPKALLIVDVQNDFLPGGALPAPDGFEIIPVINSLMPLFSCIIATKDWHPPHHCSFASAHQSQPGDKIEILGIQQELWPDHCIQKSAGAEFAPGLHTEKIEKIFHKGSDQKIDSYSAFYDNAHLRSTGLDEYLKNRGVDEIYIVGLTTEYCVKNSMLDAAKLGFKIHVVIDACRGIDPKDVERAIVEMRAAGASIIKSTEVKTSRN